MKSILSSPMKMPVSPTLEKSCIETMKVAELNRLSPCVASQARVVISSVPPMQ